ncbi:MAG: zinc ribbon domain-containing protein [archaeon]|nr:zinc ribbon domain-containing protein [archaeon]
MTRFCQSCAMPMENDSVLGTDSDGAPNQDYCRYCYDRGEFISKVTMEEFIEMCSRFGEQAGMTEEQMREHCSRIFPSLKRWRTE